MNSVRIEITKKVLQPMKFFWSGVMHQDDNPRFVPPFLMMLQFLNYI